jgi:hypothetical protein
LGLSTGTFELSNECGSAESHFTNSKRNKEKNEQLIKHLPIAESICCAAAVLLLCCVWPAHGLQLLSVDHSSSSI